MTELPETTGSQVAEWQQERHATSESSPQFSVLKTRIAGVRDRVRLLGEDAEELHREVQDYDLSERASVKSRLGVDALLEELSERRGLGWNDIATGAHVSLSAVRKWRRGGACTPENRMALARLAALIDLTEEAFVSEPGGWLLMPVLDGYTVRYLDLVAADRSDLVLDCAFGRKNAKSVLEEFDSSWRDQYRRKFDVVIDGDGVRGLRRIGQARD